MPGFSITLLLLPGANADSTLSKARILSLLDEPADAPGWKWSSRSSPAAKPKKAPAAGPTQPTKTTTAQLEAPDSASFKASVEKACKALIAAEPEITRMDTIAGDGDCGLTLKVRHRQEDLVLWLMKAFNRSTTRLELKVSSAPN